MEKRPVRVKALLEEHGPSLHALLRRLTLRSDVVEELFHELFVTLSCSPGFLLAKDPARYAFRTAMNLAFTWRRRQVRAPEPLLAEPARADAADPLAAMIADEEVRHLLAAIDTLPRLQREVIVLRYIQQESYEWMSAHLNRSPQQLRAVCHKAMVALRNRLTRSER